MAFFKFHKTKESAADKAGTRAAGPQAQAQDMRARARHRLIGAVALVVLAVIVFPLLFDTEQRPAVVDAPVVIASSGAVTQSEPTTPAPGVDTQPVAPTNVPDTAEPTAAIEGAPIAEASPPENAEAAEAADDNEEWALGPEVEPLAGADAASPGQEPSATQSKIRVTPAPAPAAAREQASASPAGRATNPPTARSASDDAEARRALAALQGRTVTQRAAPAAPAGQKSQFVVQVGAFAQDDQVRDVQRRIANAGLKSYTQVVQTGAGARTRVRVGPYGSRDDAERARAALQKGGLPGQVLAL